MRTIAHVLLVGVGAGLVFSGCTVKSGISDVTQHPNPSFVLGKQSKIGFQYHTIDRICAFSCAMMQGTEEEIDISPSQAEGVVIESSDPTIVLFQHDSNITVTNQDH